MVKTESNFWRFPQDERFEDKKKGFVTPGPGMYETMRMGEGMKKSMLGEVVGKNKTPDNGVPGPGSYLGPNIPKSKSVPGFKIKPPSYIKEEKKQKGKPVGPQKYNPQNPNYTSYAWKMGTGKRGEIRTASNRIETPGPAHDYNIGSQFDAKAKFSMGMRTKGKGANGADCPGPGEYEVGVPKNLNGHAHVIGTGQRSDLGVGKAYLAPGPGQYNVRSKHDGKKVSFGLERKKNKIKKGYDPGPGSYNLPGTVGNIPRYMLIANKQAASKFKRSKSAVSSKC